MGVPTTGNFDMFGTGSTSSIQGAMNDTGDSVDGLTTFTELIAASNAGKFNFAYAGEVQDPSTDINESLQFRGYPVDPGICRAVWVDDTVDSNRYGLRYRLPSTQNKDTLFNSLFGTPYTYGGNTGVVYNICSTLSPSIWDSSNNTLVELGELVVDFVDGGDCYVNTDCVWQAPPTPTPTATPTITPTATPTNTPSPTPTPTPTSTPIPYNYYTVRGCPGSFYEGQDMRIRTLSSLNVTGDPTTSEGISWNGQSFYSYATIDEITWQTNADLASINYDGAITFCPAPTPTPTPTITPTPTPTPEPATATPTPTPTVTPIQYNYYFVRTCPPQSVDRVVRTLSTMAVGSGPDDSTAVSIFGTCYYAYSFADINDYNNNAGDESSVDINGLTLYYTGCPGCQGFTPTPTATPTPTPEPATATPTPTPTPQPATATPTPTPTPVVLSYIIENSDGSQYEYIARNTGFTTNDLVAIVGYGSECWTVGGDSFVAPTVTVAGACTPPTPTPIPPTPTPTPSCVEISGISYSSSDSTTACNAPTGRIRGDAESLFSASVIYGDINCSTTASPGYYSDGSNWRYWNGSVFTSLGACDSY